MFSKLNVRLMTAIVAAMVTFAPSGVFAKSTESNDSWSQASLVASSSLTDSSVSKNSTQSQPVMGIVQFIDGSGKQISSSKPIARLNSGLLQMPDLIIAGHTLDSVRVGTVSLVETNSSLADLTSFSGQAISEQQLTDLFGDGNGLNAGVTLQYSNAEKNTVTVRFVDENGNSVGIPDENYTGTSDESSFTVRVPEVVNYKANTSSVEIDFSNSHSITVVYNSSDSSGDERTSSSVTSSKNSTGSDADKQSSSDSVDSNSNNELSSLSNSQTTSSVSQLNSSTSEKSVVGITTDNQQKSSVESNSTNTISQQNNNEQQNVSKASQAQQSYQASVDLTSNVQSINQSSESNAFSSAGEVSSTRDRIVKSVMKNGGTESANTVSSKVSKVSGSDVAKETAHNMPSIKSATLSVATLSAVGIGLWWLRRQ